MLRAARLRRRGDEGTIAVMAAVIIPVILAVLGLALSSLVWGTSESEVQRASDEAAVDAAAAALLTDFPYSSVDPTAVAYPTLQSVTGTSTSAGVASACTAVGNPVAAAASALSSLSVPTVPPVGGPLGGVVNPVTGGIIPGTTTTVTSQALQTLNTAVSQLPAPLQAAFASIPTTCNGLGPVSPIPTQANTTYTDACITAASSMDSSQAPWSNNFFGGSGGSVPTCANGRVRVAAATGSPLLGLGNSGASVSNAGSLSRTDKNGNVTTYNADGSYTYYDAKTKQTTAYPAPVSSYTLNGGFSAVQAALVPLGVRLGNVLPNAVCPQVSVGVDQPVNGVLDPMSTPNGRSTAKRLLKNVVVVPVFNGQHLESSTSTQTSIAVGGLASVSAGVNGGASVTTSALDLNSEVLQRQQARLNSVLGTVDSAINAAVSGLSYATANLPGVTSSMNFTSAGPNGSTTVTSQNPTVTPTVSGLDLLQCIRQTVTQLYNPPTGGAATVDQVLKQAAKDGSPVTLVQVGALPCPTPTPSAAAATDTFNCMTAAVPGATSNAVSAVTGLYDVPFLDVTQTMISDLHNGNYEAVPVHTSQANGAFRAVLVRSAADGRYVP